MGWMQELRHLKFSHRRAKAPPLHNGLVDEGAGKRSQDT